MQRWPPTPPVDRPCGPASILLAVLPHGPGNQFPLDLPDGLLNTPISAETFSQWIQTVNDELSRHVSYHRFPFGVSVLSGLLALICFVLMWLYPKFYILSLVAVITWSVMALSFFAVAVSNWNESWSRRLQAVSRVVEVCGRYMNYILTGESGTTRPIQRAYVTPDTWVEVHRMRPPSADAPTMAWRFRWTMRSSCCCFHWPLIEAIDIYWDPTAPPLRTPQEANLLSLLAPFATPVPISVPVLAHAIGE